MSSGGVMLSGWLRKSPPENKLKSRHHSWKKRWFVLKSGRLTGDPNVLEYSKYQTSKRPIKIIDLNDCKQIDANVTVPIKNDKKDFSQHFIFSIVTSNRTFYLIADSNREMSSWVRCLCDLCGFNNDIVSEKDGIGNQKKTFSSCPATVVVHNPGGSATAAPVLEPDHMHSSQSNSEKSFSDVASSKALYQNGMVNTSYSHSPANGYDSADQDNLNAKGGFAHDGKTDGRLSAHSHTNIVPAPVIISEPDTPMSGHGDSEYLHLANCETAPGSTLQAVDRSDFRRCSTDSVFEHDDSKPADDLPLTNFLPRFAESRRLDSMPNVPPPAPPVGVDPMLRNLTIDDDDDDDAVEARRKPKSMVHKSTRVDGEGIYNVPSTIPRHATVREDPGEYKGRSSSSYNSAKQYATEYMNTPSGSYSTASEMSDSPYPGAGLLSASSATSGSVLHDDLNIMSPIFPMSGMEFSPPGIVLKPPSESDKPIDKESTLSSGHFTRDGRSDIIPPARPPKPMEMSPKELPPAVAGSTSGAVANGAAVSSMRLSPKHSLIANTQFESTRPDGQASIRNRPVASATNSPLSTPIMQRSNTCAKSPVASTRLAPPNVEAGGALSSIYDVPKPLQPLKHSDKDVALQSSSASSSVTAKSIPEFDDFANPSYEKMGSPCYINNEGTLTSSPRYQHNSSPLTLVDPTFCQDSPPPVHRDLKPGRKSLGSDGGSSQGGMDPRKNSSRDSYTSEEGVSPPHTTVVSVSHFADLPLSNNMNTGHSVSNNSGSLGPWHGPMPAMVANSPPQRPPRSVHQGVSNLPPSPLVSPTPGPLTRSYSPCHIPVRNSNTEKLGIISSPSSPIAPERPPKPLSMKTSYMRGADVPPRRPPKRTDSSVHGPQRPSKPIGSMLVPAPPSDPIEKQITYMELDIDSQRSSHSHLLQDSAMDRSMNDLVEYTQLDVGKTQALEKMKKERQSQLHQKSAD